MWGLVKVAGGLATYRMHGAVGSAAAERGGELVEQARPLSAIPRDRWPGGPDLVPAHGDWMGLRALLAGGRGPGSGTGEPYGSLSRGGGGGRPTGAAGGDFAGGVGSGGLRRPGGPRGGQAVLEEVIRVLEGRRRRIPAEVALQAVKDAMAQGLVHIADGAPVPEHPGPEILRSRPR